MSVDAFAPWLEYAIEAFGVDRCMFASNFPVDAMYGTFDELYGTFSAVTAGLDSESARSSSPPTPSASTAVRRHQLTPRIAWTMIARRRCQQGGTMTYRLARRGWAAALIAVVTVLVLALLLGTSRGPSGHPLLAPAGNRLPDSSSDGALAGSDDLVHDFTRVANGHLVEFVHDNVGGRPWNAYDLSVGAPGGGPIASNAIAVLDDYAGLTHVYVRTPAGDLVEYVNNALGGHPWNAYDLSAGAGGGGHVADDPAVTLDYGDQMLHVYVNTPTGQLTEYVNDNAGGHPWNAYDLSFGAHGGVPISGTPTSSSEPLFSWDDTYVHVYARSAAGDLVEFVNDMVGGHLWNVYDLSFGSGGGGPITSDPMGLLNVDDGLAHVYVRNGAGHLVEYASDNLGGHPWNVYDLSFGAGGGGPIAGAPNALLDLFDGLVHVYVNTPAGQLTEYVNDNAAGHPWNAYDLSGGAGGGGPITGTPGSVVGYDTFLLHAFAWTPGGDLVEYAHDNAGGHPWNAYDLSAGTGVR